MALHFFFKCLYILAAYCFFFLGTKAHRLGIQMEFTMKKDSVIEFYVEDIPSVDTLDEKGPISSLIRVDPVLIILKGPYFIKSR